MSWWWWLGVGWVLGAGLVWLFIVGATANDVYVRGFRNGANQEHPPQRLTEEETHGNLDT